MVRHDHPEAHPRNRSRREARPKSGASAANEESEHGKYRKEWEDSDCLSRACPNRDGVGRCKHATDQVAEMLD